MTDPFVGKLTYFRVYSGQIKSGDRVLQHDERQDRADQPHPQMHANREEREEITAGEIAAAVGVKSCSTTGDTLAADSAPIVLERMTFPGRCISVAIEPKTKATRTSSRRACSASPRRIRPSR